MDTAPARSNLAIALSPSATNCATSAPAAALIASATKRGPSQTLRLIVFVRELGLHHRLVAARKRNREGDDFVHADQFAADPTDNSFRHTVGDTRRATVVGHSLGVLVRHLNDAEQEIGAAAAELAHRIVAAGRFIGAGVAEGAGNHRRNDERAEKFCIHGASIDAATAWFNPFPLRLRKHLSKLAAMELRGKTALVTGAAKRLGREIAVALARRGANIIVHYNTSVADARAVV